MPWRVEYLILQEALLIEILELFAIKHHPHYMLPPQPPTDQHRHHPPPHPQPKPIQPLGSLYSRLYRRKSFSHYIYS